MKTGALAEIGALVGDPGRANMLFALVDGRALTARELADQAGVTPQTASGHLSRLVAAGLIRVEPQGRHRYHRLASAEVASMLEAMMQVASFAEPKKPLRLGPRDEAMRKARSCYDHLAGQLGVALADSLVARKLVELDGDGGEVTRAGEQFLMTFGIDATAPTRGRRPFCRPCLDWSERRPHLAGHLGAQLLDRTLELGWVRRLKDTRALAITPKGQQGFRKTFDVSL
ncbi:MAG TPA: winged helix-turn-helix domain-containing protein [Caulobacteraceae bacterium]|jgi:DNA-binding transcriptional ArsR family regulator|nr:winged helix-turn-helix domain-containing protein [Caulobacteraceae bacterium]